MVVTAQLAALDLAASDHTNATCVVFTCSSKFNLGDIIFGFEQVFFLSLLPSRFFLPQLQFTGGLGRMGRV